MHGERNIIAHLLGQCEQAARMNRLEGSPSALSIGRVVSMFLRLQEEGKIDGALGRAFSSTGMDADQLGRIIANAVDSHREALMKQAQELRKEGK